MNFLILSIIAELAIGQQNSCVYNSGRYTLNLTNQSSWTLELETPQMFYYYTPCRNGIQCRQGNADFYSNNAEFKQGANQCLHYLSVDHHEAPEYMFYGAAWRFEYEDGEVCDITQQPRKTTIYYHCNEEDRPMEYYDINEPRPCEYVIDLRGREACVPESSHNEMCQWRVSNGTGGYYYLDLSPLNTTTLYSRLPNGYYHTITPCRNGLYCYQQYGNRQVMGAIDNHQTGTCEHYGAVWEDGRVQPVLHNVGTTSEHWSFHYYNGEKCSNGLEGEEEFRFYCDPTQNATVMNTTGSDCRFEINIATKYACTSQADKSLPKNFRRLTGNVKSAAKKIGQKIIKGIFGN